MRKPLKTLVAIVTVTALSVSQTYAGTPTIEDGDIVMESYDTFIQEEMDDNSTDLDNDLEQELNSQGILDSQIESWSDETIEKINESDDVSVEVMYFNEEDDGELSELSDEEVEKFFEKVYDENLDSDLHDGQYVEFEDDREEIIDDNNSVLAMFGLEETVYGADDSMNGTVKSSSGMLKCDIVVVKDKGKKNYIDVFQESTWLSQPKYTMTDYMGVTSYGLDTFMDYNCCHYADYTFTENSVQPGGRLVQFNEKTHSKPVVDDDCGVCTYVNLCDDIPGIAYRNHTILLYGEFHVNNYNTTDGRINFKFRYYHQQKKLSNNISVTPAITTSGLSLSLSNGISVDKYYHRMINKTYTYCFSCK